MKKKVFAGLLASVSLLSLVVSSGSAYATEADSYDTRVGIGFTGHDPGPGTGDLRLAWAPIEFDFGKANEVNTLVQDFDEDTGSNKYLVVQDLRATDPANTWELTAGLSNLTSGSSRLIGAELNYDVAIKDYNGDGSELPEQSGVVTTLTDRTAVLSNSATTGSETFAQGDPAKVVMSDVAESYNGFTAMEMTNIKLNVPANIAQAGRQYSGTLTWSLDDTVQ